MSAGDGATVGAAGLAGTTGGGVCAPTGSVVAHMKTSPRPATISRTFISLLSSRLEGLRQGQANLGSSIVISRQICMSLIVSGDKGQVHSARNIKTKGTVKRRHGLF